ncbi:MAG: tetratricopeptide repeat protein [Deltaproteobacteria bacterium]|nr:tetratricopeptide repeat protein [Deltaproteobacteria bacterium]
MAEASCPKCGQAVAADDVFCPSCDCVLDVAQVLGEAEGTAEIDILGIDEGEGGEEVLFDPEAEPAEPPVQGGWATSRLDADLAAELAQVLEDGTGTVELADDSDEGEVAFDPASPLDAAALFDEPLASAEGEPIPPPVFDEKSDSWNGEALILGDAPATPQDFESMLTDSTSAISIAGCTVEPAPVYMTASVQQMTAPTAVLQTKDELLAMLPQLSPFERHVVNLVNGKRTVLRIAKKAGLSMSDAVVALGLLADRGLLELLGHARLKGAPPTPAPYRVDTAAPPAAALPRTTTPGVPLELPLDALTPLPLPDDALTPLAPLEAALPSPFDDEEVAVRPAAAAVAVRPALSLKPATAATAPRAGLVVRDEPAAPAPKPRAGLVVKDLDPPAAAPAAPTRPAAPSMSTARAAPDPAVQARAMQLIEVALQELREGRKVTALAWVKMAAELVPGDPKIESLLASWNGAPATGASPLPLPPPPASAAQTEDQRLAAQARALEAAGDMNGAANAYRRALKLKPSDPELYNRLGILLALRMKDLIGATAALKKALENAPTNLAYRSNLGKVVKMAAGEKLADQAMYGGDEAHKVKPAAESKKPASFLERLKGLRKD